MINSVIACLFLFVFGAVLFVVNATASFLLGAGGRAAFSEFQAPGFAPPSLLALIPPSKGANFFLPGAGRRAQGLLPLPF